MKIEIEKVKIIVTIPPENTDDIIKSVCSLGAGVIGNYTYCTTRTKCMGTFMPMDSANPYIGKNNNLEYVTEDKLEFVCDIKLAKIVIQKLKETHPYEEPAIDIIPLIGEKWL